MILTPEQIENWVLPGLRDGWDGPHHPDPETEQTYIRHLTGYVSTDLADTLAAYADIVQRVAEDNFSYWDVTPRCFYCDADMGEHSDEEHASDCLYLAARKLRGLDGT
jgi:hypothetical protein